MEIVKRVAERLASATITFAVVFVVAYVVNTYVFPVPGEGWWYGLGFGVLAFCVVLFELGDSY